MANTTQQTPETLETLGANGINALSNGDGFSLPTTAAGLAQLSPETEEMFANGIPLDELEEDDEEEEEEEEEVDEDYVAVDHDDVNDISYWFRRPPVHHRTKLDELHPFVQVLTQSDVDECVSVESAFPEQERCSREKFMYRLGKCPELCLGLFTLPIIEKGQPKPPPTLVGHIIATRISTPLVSDNSMKLPTNWQTERITLENGQAIGHEEGGATIAIHSLAVRPEHQGKQVGSTLMKSYIQRIKEAAIADRISIIAHDHLVPFYESFGFESRGPSKCQFAGGGWTDLVLEFNQE